MGININNLSHFIPSIFIVHKVREDQRDIIPEQSSEAC